MKVSLKFLALLAPALLLLLAASSFGASVSQGVISTFAGVGTTSGGLATQTELDLPDSARTDDVGNIWICDTSNQRILRVDASTNVVTLIAGNGTAGYSGDGGPAVNAELDNPVATVFETASLTSDNLLYVSDQGNEIIRCVDIDTGIITTVAGTPQQSGYAGDTGLATSALLNAPYGVHQNGNFVYFADSGNNVIRQINTTTGIITTVAGSSAGLPGSSGDGGPAIGALLNGPLDVVAYNGVTYIADTGNFKIRAIEANGSITTVAGVQGSDTPVTEGSLPFSTHMDPRSIKIDSVGDIFYADQANHRVREIYNITVTPSCVSTVAGTGVNGYSGDGLSATAAEISNPYSVGVDYRNYLYIADRNNARIRKVNLNTGIISTIAGDGNGDGNPANAAILKDPFGIAIDAAGDVFIADRNDFRVRRVDGKTGIITTIAGTGDFGHTDGLTTTAEVGNPMSVVVDPSTGNIYFTESYNSSSYLREIPAGYLSVTTIAGGPNGYTTTGTAAMFYDPQGLFWDPQGNGFYICDTNNDIIERYSTQFGSLSLVAGTAPVGVTTNAVPQSGYAGDGGPAVQALLYHPYGIYVDGQEDIYFADASNSCIRRIDGTSHNITTVAGQGGQFGYSGDGGLGSACTVDFPMGVWLDANHNLLVDDTIDDRIREINAGSDIVSTIAGNGLSGYSGDGGQPNAAVLSHPEVMAEDAKGNIYFADNVNNRIREISYAAQATPVPLVGSNSVMAFPSPASSQVCFAFQASGGGAVEVKVYNMAYQLVANITGQAAALSGQSQNLCSDISRLANGAYIFQLSVNGSNYPLSKFKVIH